MIHQEGSPAFILHKSSFATYGRSTYTLAFVIQGLWRLGSYPCDPILFYLGGVNPKRLDLVVVPAAVCGVKGVIAEVAIRGEVSGTHFGTQLWTTYGNSQQAIVGKVSSGASVAELFFGFQWGSNAVWGQVVYFSTGFGGHAVFSSFMPNGMR